MFVGHRILLLTILVCGLTPLAFADEGCVEFLDSFSSKNVGLTTLEDETSAFTSYLGFLLENRLIKDQELLRFIAGLEKETIINPIPDEEALIDFSKSIHREQIQQYIDNATLNTKKLLDFAISQLKLKENIQISKEDVKQQTKDPFKRIELYPVPPAKFGMGEGRNKKMVTLTNTIEVMSTLVTQRQWVEVMGENPSRFAKGEDWMQVRLKSKWIHMQPDNPVENVTWWSVLVFANKLSEKYKLKPAYDLSGIKWREGTRAENGTLEPESGEIKIVAHNKSHGLSRGEFYYQAEGFRLPTDAEQEYLMRAGGRSKGKYCYGSNKAELKDHAWFSENSKAETHPVAMLQPIIINGQKFYDLYGNVFEWGWDWYDEQIKSGENQFRGPRRGDRITFSHVYRGGHYQNGVEQLCNSYRDRGVMPLGSIGFRLVRTVL